MVDDDHDEEAELLSVAREEAHRTIDNQIQTLDDIDSKAARILRINLVLLSIVLTGFSIASSSTEANPAGFEIVQLLNNYTYTGLILLLLSTAVAGVTYTASNMKAGVSPNDLQSVLDNDYSAQQNLEGIIESYANWIERNYRVNAKNAPLGTLTTLLLIAAMAFLALGFKKAVTAEVEWWLLSITVILLLSIAHFAGLYGQLQQYHKLR